MVGELNVSLYLYGWMHFWGEVKRIRRVEEKNIVGHSRMLLKKTNEIKGMIPLSGKKRMFKKIFHFFRK